MDKLYLITHEKLPPGQQAVQAAHAMRQFGFEYTMLEAQWFERSNTLAFLAAPDTRALEVLRDKALRKGVAVAAFYEPDRDNELTAIALGPEGKKITRRLPLALQSGVI